MNIILCRFNDYESGIRHVREAVFIQEQHVPPELEWDGLDEAADHTVALTNQNAVVATARMLTDGHIGRMAILPEWRRQCIGSQMLKKLIAQAQSKGLKAVWLSAQVNAIPFYIKHGFVVNSNDYLDAGIWHRDMILDLTCTHSPQ